MLNIKCSHRRHECPEGLDVCCQFCEKNYSPCEGKCSGCWDVDQMTGISIFDKASLGSGIDPKIESEAVVPIA
jgi:hypothetical protein